jgi:hypothetical protein
MAGGEAFDAIETTLKDGWSTTPLVFENEFYEPPDTPAPFVYVEVFGDVFSQASIGAAPQSANLWREAGTLFLHVMVAAGTGTGLSRQYAAELVALFAGQEIDGVRFGDASIGAGEPGQDFANYFAMTATIMWERDE